MAIARAVYYEIFIVATASFLPAAAHGGHEGFKLGESRGCDAPWKRVTDTWACRAAMDRVDRHTPGDQNGDSFLGNENEKDWPRGCYFCRGVKDCKDGTHFNEHATGSYAKGARPYCMRWNFLVTGEVLFVGDSDIDDWKTTSELVPHSYNVGHGGYTCANVFKRVKSMRDNFRPSVVVLVCGENDLAAGTSSRKTYRRFLKITKAFHEAGAHVVYLGTKPEPATKNLHDKYRQYDQYIKELVDRRHHSHDDHDHDHNHRRLSNDQHRRRRRDSSHTHSNDHHDHHDQSLYHRRRDISHTHSNDHHDHHAQPLYHRRRDISHTHSNDHHDHHDQPLYHRRRDISHTHSNDHHDHHDHPDHHGDAPYYPYYTNHGITMIDVHRSFQEKGNPDQLYANDGLHLSSDGYHLWSHWTQSALNDLECIFWASGICESRPPPPPHTHPPTPTPTPAPPPAAVRRATMVIGSSDVTANATTGQTSSAAAGLDGIHLFNDASATSTPSQGIIV